MFIKTAKDPVTVPSLRDVKMTEVTELPPVPSVSPPLPPKPEGNPPAEEAETYEVEVVLPDGRVDVLQVSDHNTDVAGCLRLVLIKCIREWKAVDVNERCRNTQLKRLAESSEAEGERIRRRAYRDHPVVFEWKPALKKTVVVWEKVYAPGYWISCWALAPKVSPYACF